MPRVRVGLALPHQKTLDVEIARLRDLDVGALRARWHSVLGRRAPPHLPRHLLFRVLAYRLQADRIGDLDAESRRLLDGAGSPEDAGKRAVDLHQVIADLRPGTMLAREWNGRMQRVAVLADGFAWNGKTYPSLSKIAQAITGTRWNGPRFFGLRDPRAGACGTADWLPLRRALPPQGRRLQFGCGNDSPPARAKTAACAMSP